MNAFFAGMSLTSFLLGLEILGILFSLAGFALLAGVFADQHMKRQVAWVGITLLLLGMAFLVALIVASTIVP